MKFGSPISLRYQYFSRNYGDMRGRMTFLVAPPTNPWPTSYSVMPKPHAVKWTPPDPTT